MAKHGGAALSGEERTPTGGTRLWAKSTRLGELGGRAKMTATWIEIACRKALWPNRGCGGTGHDRNAGRRRQWPSDNQRKTTPRRLNDGHQRGIRRAATRMPAKPSRLQAPKQAPHQAPQFDPGRCWPREFWPQEDEKGRFKRHCARCDKPVGDSAATLQTKLSQLVADDSETHKTATLQYL